MKELTLVKVGGSLITDKDKPYTAQIDNIRLVCQEIKSALVDNPNLRLVLANGVGSFAHTSAKKYDTMHGFNDDKGRLGCAKVMYDALEINRIFVEQLLECGIPAIHFQPSAIFISAGGQHKSENIMALNNAVEQGLIPVLYGDVILDAKQGSTIYSADKTMPLLARKLNDSKEYQVNNFINIGNYDGVLDKDKKLINEINSTNIAEVRTYFFENGQIDVTGGMGTKVEELFKLAQYGVNSIIVNGAVKGRAYSTLMQKSVIGTKIMR